MMSVVAVIVAMSFPVEWLRKLRTLKGGLLKARVRPVYLALALVPVACSEAPIPLQTNALQGSNDVSFVCVDDEPGKPLRGLPLEACPGQDGVNDGDSKRTLFALLTQPKTGEVAVLNMGACAPGRTCAATVQDAESTDPAPSFLPVGAEPVSIVSTPGGLASFVAVAEPGKEGIFGLATECVGLRPDGEPYRDLRSWPACRLPSAPGVMVIIEDRNRQTNCQGQSSAASESVACTADLSKEKAGFGRIKLVVTLPELGSVALIDAQDLLNSVPGEFADCPLEQLTSGDDLLALQVDLSGYSEAQLLPADLQGDEAVCSGPFGGGYRHADLPESFSPAPSDMDLSEGQLYVSDSAAPVVHVLDVRDPCAMTEGAPLYPKSVLDPESVIVTRKVTVSPRTFGGERFAYAVDGTSGSAGSVMVFDLSHDDTPRTPLVRPRSASLQQEPPDRIHFSGPVSDITFARHDFPVADPESGIAVGGVTCDPDPTSATSGPNISLGTLYRPGASDSNPGPLRLRGVFAFAVLHSGLVVTIDVEDLDAPCRRPATTHAAADEDHNGCAGDDYPEGTFLEESPEAPYVSGELSCHIVEPHRRRLGRRYSGSSAPIVAGFPQLRADDGSSLSVDQNERGVKNPRLLAVNLEPGGVDEDGSSEGDAYVRIGRATYRNDPSASDRLELDPAQSERNSLVVPVSEPRAHSSGAFTVTYEGVVQGRDIGSFDVVRADELDLPDSEQVWLDDHVYGAISGGVDGRFCASGIEDEVLVGERGVQELGIDPQHRIAFARRHADFAEVTSELLRSADPYWAGAGAECGEPFREPGDGLSGREVCDLFFGDSFNRELRVVRSYHDRLLVEPRDSGQPREVSLDMLNCCFPEGVEFRILAGRHWIVRGPRGVAHNIRSSVNAPFACHRDCGPLGAAQDGRVFELSCDDSAGSCVAPGKKEPSLGGPELDQVGELSGDKACILTEHPSGGVQPGAPGSECIYSSQTARFAIYRGAEPTRRGMQFSWGIVGGVSSHVLDILSFRLPRGNNKRSLTTAPRKITYLPSLGHLVVVDGASAAMALIGLTNAYNGGPGMYGNLAE